MVRAIHSFITIMLIVGLPVSASAQQPMHAAPVAGKIELHLPVVVLPLKTYGGRPVVAFTINGKGPYDFIVDTGARISIIDPALASDLHLTQIGEVRAGSPGHHGGVNAGLFNVDRMTAGGLDIHGLMIAGIRMPFSKSDAPHGALSPAQLAGYLITFDFPTKRIEIKLGSLPAPNGTTVFQYSTDSQVPALPISVAGKSLEVNVDLGSGAGLTLPNKYVANLPLDAKPVPVKTIRLVDAAIPATAAHLRGTLVIGHYKVVRPRIVFADVGDVGTIGAGLLSQFAVTIDIANRRIQLKS
jgi:hypothetical protein